MFGISEPTVFGATKLELQRSYDANNDIENYVHGRTLERSGCDSNAHFCLDIFVDDVHIEISLWDTAGQEEFDRLRSLSYDDTHAIMLCFSVSGG